MSKSLIKMYITIVIFLFYFIFFFFALLLFALLEKNSTSHVVAVITVA